MAHTSSAPTNVHPTSLAARRLGAVLPILAVPPTTTALFPRDDSADQLACACLCRLVGACAGVISITVGAVLGVAIARQIVSQGANTSQLGVFWRPVLPVRRGRQCI